MVERLEETVLDTDSLDETDLRQTAEVVEERGHGKQNFGMDYRIRAEGGRSSDLTIDLAGLERTVVVDIPHALQVVGQQEPGIDTDFAVQQQELARSFVLVGVHTGGRRADCLSAAEAVHKREVCYPLGTWDCLYSPPEARQDRAGHLAGNQQDTVLVEARRQTIGGC
jgi:predicted alpha/beta-hydrolase family hydrolase